MDPMKGNAGPLFESLQQQQQTVSCWEKKGADGGTNSYCCRRLAPAGILPGVPLEFVTSARAGHCSRAHTMGARSRLSR